MAKEVNYEALMEDIEDCPNITVYEMNGMASATHRKGIPDRALQNMIRNARHFKYETKVPNHVPSEWNGIGLAKRDPRTESTRFSLCGLDFLFDECAKSRPKTSNKGYSSYKLANYSLLAHIKVEGYNFRDMTTERIKHVYLPPQIDVPREDMMHLMSWIFLGDELPDHLKKYANILQEEIAGRPKDSGLIDSLMGMFQGRRKTIRTDQNPDPELVRQMDHVLSMPYIGARMTFHNTEIPDDSLIKALDYCFRIAKASSDLEPKQMFVKMMSNSFWGANTLSSYMPNGSSPGVIALRLLKGQQASTLIEAWRGVEYSVIAGHLAEGKLRGRKQFIFMGTGQVGIQTENSTAIVTMKEDKIAMVAVHTVSENLKPIMGAISILCGLIEAAPGKEIKVWKEVQDGRRNIPKIGERIERTLTIQGKARKIIGDSKVNVIVSRRTLPLSMEGGVLNSDLNWYTTSHRVIYLKAKYVDRPIGFTFYGEGDQKVKEFLTILGGLTASFGAHALVNDYSTTDRKTLFGVLLPFITPMSNGFEVTLQKFIDEDWNIGVQLMLHILACLNLSPDTAGPSGPQEALSFKIGERICVISRTEIKGIQMTQNYMAHSTAKISMHATKKVDTTYKAMALSKALLQATANEIKDATALYERTQPKKPEATEYMDELDELQPVFGGNDEDNEIINSIYTLEEGEIF